jgi:hypothetical protein
VFSCKREGPDVLNGFSAHNFGSRNQLTALGELFARHFSIHHLLKLVQPVQALLFPGLFVFDNGAIWFLERIGKGKVAHLAFVHIGDEGLLSHAEEAAKGEADEEDCCFHKELIQLGIYKILEYRY